MKVVLLVAALLVAVSSPSAAAVQVINNGNGTSTLRLSYTVQTAAVPEIRDSICASGIVSGTETCLQAIDRAVADQLRLWLKAGRVKVKHELEVKPVEDSDVSGEIQQ